MKLYGKTALVTGSSKGIGEAVAIRFAEEGANVIVNYLHHEELAVRVVDTIKKMGRKSVAFGADLGQAEEARRLIQDSIQQFGNLDILVNNAGIEVKAEFWMVTESDYDKVLNLNLKGVFFAAQEFSRHCMESKNSGKIINISSVHEELPFPNFAPYCLSKGGIKMLTRTLAIELAQFGITVNSIAPGAIETPINKALMSDPVKLNAFLNKCPLKRLGKPTEVAAAAVFLASGDSDYITGTTIFVDGGLLWNYEEQ